MNHIYDEMTGLCYLGCALIKAIPPEDKLNKLPIHRICYDQPHPHPNATLHHLKEATGSAGQPNATGM